MAPKATNAAPSKEVAGEAVAEAGKEVAEEGMQLAAKVVLARDTFCVCSCSHCLLSVTLDEDFAEGIGLMSKCQGHSAKCSIRVVEEVRLRELVVAPAVTVGRRKHPSTRFNVLGTPG